MLKSSLVTIALLATSQTAFAQQPPPGAGGQLQQIPPTPAAESKGSGLKVERPAAPDDNVAGGATVRVDSIRVTGSSLFSEAELIAAAAVPPGSELSLFDLRAAAARIAGHYNVRGYILAQAYLPAQEIRNGIVTVAVVEGRYGKIDLRNKSGLSDGSARQVLSGLKSGDPVSNGPLERRLLLLSDMPGVTVKSTLAPGTEIGTSDLIVNMTRGRTFSGSAEADNAGNRYTGANRLGGTLRFNNPMGRGDQLSLRLLGSTGGLAYGRAAYQVPIGNATIGAAFTHLRYALGREFNALDADGSADIFSLFGSYPLIRSRRVNLSATAGADYRLLEDRIGLFSSESDKKIRALTIGFTGETRDGLAGGGSNAFSAGWTFGRLGLESPAERSLDSLTARSQGGYGKLQFSAARLQTLSGPFSLYGAVRGQLAFDNLDSSEKMELGGAYGVRAYPEGEAYGDQGYIATAEARLLLSQWTGKLPGRLQLITFVDVGQVRFAHDPWFTGSNNADRSAYGAGLVWDGPRGFVARASYARKLGDAPATSAPDRSGRFWFQVTKLF